MADKQQSRGLTVKVDVDVSEALTGLKAVQREAKKAAQALREVEAQEFGGRIWQARELLSTQGVDGTWNYDEYLHGMYNGMELILATIEGREPEFRDAPDVFIADKPADLRKPVKSVD